MTVLAPMPPEQTAGWFGLLDLYENLDRGWTLIGGQLVHLHCAERGQSPMRPTNDVDTVVDVRADSTMLHTFTKTLLSLGFVSAGISGEGRQHRWVRDQASIDVLVPEGIGERASERRGATGSPTLQTEGGTQALHRSEAVAVSVNGREGYVRRPNLVGALVVKAAAHGNPGDPDPRRHRRDFVVLAGLLTARDFAAEEVSKTDRRRLGSIVAAINADRELLLEMPDAASSMGRLATAARLV
ncbi:hypothetical protein [Jatrophihabitans sp.]|uniref:hypothetical protein n=1 Tax=Jatrophihabitans sp. TaxID=1932789 RepID=UPI0030C706D2|nr:hypothetical protein [Jatrophihabitans sp.]